MSDAETIKMQAQAIAQLLDLGSKNDPDITNKVLRAMLLDRDEVIRKLRLEVVSLKGRL